MHSFLAVIFSKKYIQSHGRSLCIAEIAFSPVVFSIILLSFFSFYNMPSFEPFSIPSYLVFSGLLELECLIFAPFLPSSGRHKM